MTTQLFPELAGIKPERSIAIVDKPSLEYLLEVGKNICCKFEKYDLTRLNWTEKTNEFYLQMYKDVSEQLENIEFDEFAIKDFILAKVNAERKLSKQLTLGMYTGCLAHLLTEKNKAQGKGTKIHIDLKNQRFDGLFYNAKQIDELIVENAAGNNICNNIGSYGGHVNKLICNNIQGHLVMMGVAEKGQANQIIGANIKGHWAMFTNAFAGKSTQIIGMNIKGKYSMRRIAEKGQATQVIGIDIEDKNAMLGIADKGNVNQLISYTTLNLSNYKYAEKEITGKPAEKYLTPLIHLSNRIDAGETVTAQEIIDAVDQLEVPSAN